MADRDDENPEWTKADFARARPGGEVLPAEVVAAFGKPRGRPKSVSPKVAIKLRVDQEVLAAYRLTGPGWQTRMNDALKSGLGRKRA